MFERTRTQAQKTCSLKDKQRMSIIGHISKTLIKVGHRLMSAWKILQVIVKFDGKRRGALEGTWLPDGRIEIPCFYFFIG